MKLRSVSLAVFAAVPAVALLTAGTAAAAPEDVALTATVSGSTVTTTITNNTGADVFCMIYGTKPGTNPEVDPITFSAGLGDWLEGAALDPVKIPAGGGPLTYPDIPVGEYQVDWACVNNYSGEPGHEEWGTPGAISAYATTQPVLVTVSAVPAPAPAPGSGSASIFGS
ncbi:MULTISPECIES: hypothetical protein [unclassified Rhodococcus (in: high G+C Gram-positive bacteria)]|uniref:hypothetical protein n=1 Tax=unclassified Rhodococcus (in: high G+C Gram-positive bacteria) TaxID=192944 RepID=UPI00163B0913|nr:MULTISPECIES: hypothetical protein [unclassified Rhodococcus (in: high G+C Gram-positive bacteria)]MBC2644809.1 hypothetical protein [Rhodococcus sp. 3A]MBC2890811.1 hypothetical protein [Rhodococcus sp. 4CII]